jgi:hypothetical protein
MDVRTKKSENIQRLKLKKKYEQKSKEDEDDEKKQQQKKPKCEIECKKGNTKMCSELALKCQRNFKSRNYKPQYTPSGGYMYTNPAEFKVDTWDPNDLPEDTVISIIWVGKRRTGKSFAERWYLAQRGNAVKEVYVFSKTTENGWYQKFLPEAFVFKGWQPEIAETILDRGKMQVKRGVDKSDVGIVVIGDDLISDHGMRFDEILDELYTAGRHSGVEAHWMTQAYKALPPQTRKNADILVIFTIINGMERKAVIEEYLTEMNRQTATELLDMYTDPEEHTALIIEAWRNSHDPEQYLKVLKAEDPHIGPGDIGTVEYWEEGEKDLGGGNIDGPNSYMMDFNYKRTAQEGMRNMF